MDSTLALNLPRSGSLAMRRGLEAGSSASHGLQQGIPIRLWIGTPRGESLFGFGKVGAGARGVNIFGSFRRFRQDGNALGQNFGKTADNGDVAGGGTFLVSERADPQFGKQGRVARKDSEVAGETRHLNFRDGFANHFAFRRNHLESESVSHDGVGFGRPR